MKAGLGFTHWRFFKISDEDKRSFNFKLTEKGATIAGEIDETPTDLQNLFEGFRDEELARTA